MQTRDVRDSVAQLKQALEENGYSKRRILQFSSTTNQLLKFMGTNGLQEYSMDVGLRFMGEHYGFKAEETLSHVNQGRILDLTMLSEFQLHGTYTMRHRNQNYHIPEPFRQATEAFLAHRRFTGIIERNMGTISLYLERFFRYLASQNVMELGQITGKHVHGFLRYISGYSNQTKDHMMRTVRQFMEFCWRNRYHPQNLASFAPNVHYDKRAHIPSAYSYDEVMKILGMVDRNNPVGKRNYAMRAACNGRDFVPAIIVDPYEKRYFGITPPTFDPVDLSRLCVTFRSSSAQIKPIPATLQEMEQLREMIVSAGGRVYSTEAKGTQAIITADWFSILPFQVIQAVFTNLPEGMAHLSAVAAGSDLGFPVAAHDLQRVVKPEQKFRVAVIAGIQQSLMELLGGSDLRGHGDQFRDRFLLERIHKSCVVFIQPFCQLVSQLTVHRSFPPFRMA